MHRERLSTTDANTRIFGDNREARRIRRIHEVGIQPLEFPEDDGGIQLAIFLPYMEPVLYFSWLFPLNHSAYRMLEQIPFFFEEDDLIIQTLLSVTSSSFILSLILDPLPAINYLEVGTDVCQTLAKSEGTDARTEGLMYVFKYNGRTYERCDAWT